MSVLFIVTVSEGTTATLLRNNLGNALQNSRKKFNGKNVWVPLMGTGVGGLTFEESYDIIVSVLRVFPAIDFTISIPNDKRGQRFIKLLDTKNSKIQIEVHPQEDSPKEIDDLNVFLVGAHWSGEDQTNRFIRVQ